MGNGKIIIVRHYIRKLNICPEAHSIRTSRLNTIMLTNRLFLYIAALYIDMGQWPSPSVNLLCEMNNEGAKCC